MIATKAKSVNALHRSFFFTFALFLILGHHSLVQSVHTGDKWRIESFLKHYLLCVSSHLREQCEDGCSFNRLGLNNFLCMLTVCQHRVINQMDPSNAPLRNNVLWWKKCWTGDLGSILTEHTGDLGHRNLLSHRNPLWLATVNQSLNIFHTFKILLGLRCQK